MAILNNSAYPSGGTAKRTAKGSLMTILGEGISALRHILLVPLFLWAWGEALYGEWLILFSLVAYLSLGNIGMQTFVVNRLTQFYAKGNLSEYVKIFRSALSLYLVIIIALLLILTAFVLFNPFPDWLNIIIASEDMVKTAALILGGYILFGIIAGLITGLYDSIGEYPRKAALTNIREILLIACLAITLFFKGNFVAVAFWYLILLMGLILFVIRDIKFRHPEIDFGIASTDWRLASSFILPGFIFLMIPLADVISIQGSILVIGASLGASAVAIFGVHRTLANFVFKITSSVRLAIKPELTVAEARKDYPKIQAIYNILVKVIFFLSVSAAIFLFFSGKDIISVWTSGKIVFNPVLWGILLINLPISSLWYFSAVFQVATNQYKDYSIIRLTSAVIGLILALIFVKPFGIVGVLLGFVMAEIAINSWLIPRRTSKIIREKARDFWLIVINGAPMIILQLSLGWWIAGFAINIWLRWVILGIIIFMTGIGFVYVWLDNKEKRIVSNLLSNYFARRT